MWLWFAFSASIFSLVLIFRQNNPNNGVFVTHPVGQVILKILNIQLEIENKKALENPQACVYLANHQSLLDVFTFCAFFPAKTFVVAKRSLKYMPFFGWAFSLSGNVYIDRKNRNAAVKTLASAEERIRAGWSFFVFPEGTRSKGKGLGLFKKGAFHVAMNTGAPLRLWICKDYDLRLNSLQPSIVKMKVFDPIYLNKEEDLETQIANIRSLAQAYLDA